jgi:hypothetical protein
LRWENPLRGGCDEEEEEGGGCGCGGGGRDCGGGRSEKRLGVWALFFSMASNFSVSPVRPTTESLF